MVTPHLLAIPDTRRMAYGFLLSFLAILASATPAAANLVVWTLDDVRFLDGQTAATGSFTFDTSSNSVSSSDITVYYDAVLDTPSGSFGRVSEFAYESPQTQWSFLAGQAGVAFTDQVYRDAYPPGSLTTLTASWSLDLEIPGPDYLGEMGVTVVLGGRSGEEYYRVITDRFGDVLWDDFEATALTGSMTSSAQPVPEPPIVWSLVTGLPAFVSLARRRRTA